jgi:hypothetical protein
MTKSSLLIPKGDKRELTLGVGVYGKIRRKGAEGYDVLKTLLHQKKRSAVY